MSKVKSEWIVKLSNDVVPVVLAGSNVLKGDVLVEEKSNSQIIINITNDIKNWSVSEIRQLESELIGKLIETGEIIFQTGGFFPKKLVATCSGTVERFDELNNLYVKVGDDKSNIVCSPVAAKISLIEPEKIVLEFFANEYKGIGLNENGAWGRGLKKINVLSDLSFADENKIVLVEKISAELLSKSMVMNVKGLIVLGSNETKIDNKLPILSVDETVWNELQKETNKEKDLLLDAGNGKLLLVI